MSSVDVDYYATFFADPDGLRYEFVSNERFLAKKKARQAT